VAIHEYTWRNAINLFRPSRVLIDDERREFLFERCLRTKGFWNLLPLRTVSCRFEELCNLETYSQAGYRCVSLATPAASGVFLDSDVPRFDEFVSRLRAISSDIHPTDGLQAPSGKQSV
jgi:hypothetical protein